MLIEIRLQYLPGYSNETSSEYEMREKFDRKCEYFLSQINKMNLDAVATKVLDTPKFSKGGEISSWATNINVSEVDFARVEHSLPLIEVKWFTQESIDFQRSLTGFWSALGLITQVLDIGYLLMSPSAAKDQVSAYALAQMGQIFDCLNELKSKLDDISKALQQLPALIAAALRFNQIKGYYEESAGLIEEVNDNLVVSDYLAVRSSCIKGFGSIATIWKALETEYTNPGLSGLLSVMPSMGDLSQGFNTAERMLIDGEPCKAPTIHKISINRVLVTEHDRVQKLVSDQRAAYASQLKLIFPWQFKPETPFNAAGQYGVCFSYDDTGKFSMFKEIPVDPKPPFLITVDPSIENKYFAISDSGVFYLCVLGIVPAAPGLGGPYMLPFVQTAQKLPNTVDVPKFMRAFNYALGILPAHDWQRRVGLLTPQLDQLKASVDTKMRALPKDWCPPLY